MAYGNLKFDTLTTSDAKNTSTEKSIDTSYIFNGVAKAWCNINGTSTLATRDSFNVGSTTDGGTGNYTNNFTINMSNDGFSASVDSQDASTRTNVHSSFEGQTTSTILIYHYEGGSAVDTTRVGTMAMGDLA